mmetsp:Transcript_26024/g.87484  ORF Transcript_26024/g.87484 Transcript_26024/m.87484 type:complete len:368 (-) Transcript_26024:147-1250(-)
MSGRGSAIDGVPMWALVVGECAIVSLAAVLWAVPHWCYRLVLRKQVAYVTGRNNTAVVLALRSALILPLMATTTLIPLMVPRTFQGCELVQSVIEGYAVKCFFILVVKNVGGSGGAIRLLRRSRVCTGCGLFRSDDDEDPGCCLEYILGGARGLYAKTALAVWAFAYIRPLIVVVETAFFYSPQVGNFDYAITGLLGAAITFIMVPLLLTLVYAAMDECEGIQILYKFTVVKVVVGLILAENFLRDVLYANDRLRLGPETRGGLVPGPNSSVLNTYVRAYCSVALVQLALLSCLLDLGYGVEMALGDGALDLKSDTTPRTEDDLWRDVFYVWRPLAGEALTTGAASASLVGGAYDDYAEDPLLASRQ